MWPCTGDHAGIEHSSLQVTAPALPAAPLLFLHISRAPKPWPYLGGSFSSFHSICSALKKRKRNRKCICTVHVGGGMSVWVRSELLNRYPSYPSSSGHRAHGAIHETTRCVSDLHPDGCWSTLQPALTLPGTGCAQGPVHMLHWEHQLPSVASQLPLLAMAASLFAVKAADKRGGGERRGACRHQQAR